MTGCIYKKRTCGVTVLQSLEISCHSPGLCFFPSRFGCVKIFHIIIFIREICSLPLLINKVTGTSFQNKYYLHKIKIAVIVISWCGWRVPTICCVFRVYGSGICCGRFYLSSARTCVSRDCLQNTRTSWSCCATNKAVFTPSPALRRKHSTHFLARRFGCDGPDFSAHRLVQLNILARRTAARHASQRSVTNVLFCPVVLTL